MQTINYITYDSWWDTDQTILSNLAKDYTTNVFVLNFAKGANKYPNKDNRGFNVFVQKTQKYRDRDPRSLFTAISFYKIIRSYASKDGLNIFVPGQNIFLLLLLLFLPKRRTCICYHNHVEHIDSRKGLFVHIKKLYCRYFDKFILYSQGQLDEFRTDNPDKKTFLLNMPLKDYGTSSIIKDNRSINFLFFGYIRDYKRLDIFIDAANKVKSTRAKFIIAGKTKTPEKYEALIKDKRRFDLRLCFIANDVIPDIFSSSHYLVLPYEDSTQSGPSLVALNYSLPIIASDLPSFRSIIKDGENGHLFTLGDSDALAKVMEYVCTLSDEQLCKYTEKQTEMKLEYLVKSDVALFFKDNFNALIS